MGSLLSKKDEEKLNEAINKSLHADGKKLRSEVKLLLLGMFPLPSLSPNKMQQFLNISFAHQALEKVERAHLQNN